MKKLSCKEARRLIDSGRPDEWPDEVREAVRQHVAECAECRRELAATRMVTGALAGGARPRVAGDFSARLMQRIAEREQAKAARRARWWPTAMAWRPALAAAVVVLVVIVAAVVVMHGTGPQPAQPAGQTVAAQPDASGTQIASAADAAFVQDLVMYHQHLELAELGGDAGLLVAANGY